jgi:hypothetical protein
MLKTACWLESFASLSEHTEQYLKSKMSIIAAVLSLSYAKRLTVPNQVGYAPRQLKLC